MRCGRKSQAGSSSHTGKKISCWRIVLLGVLSVTLMLTGLKQNPDVIGMDAGSTDPGPYYLGAGVSFTSRPAVKRDIELALPEALKRGTPFIIGSGGGCGAEPHLKWNREIIEEIAKERGLHFKLAVIHSKIEKGYVSHFQTPEIRG